MTLRFSFLALALVVGAAFTGCTQTRSVTDEAGITTQEVSYELDGTALNGFLATPANGAASRPAVIVVHEWWGHNDYVRTRAQQLATMGYTAFALDMYGDGKQASHPDDAGAFMREVMSNRELMEARFLAALEQLRQQDGVDPERIGAIGYCMGGAIVLNMARLGAPLAAVASFHGNLSTGLAAEAKINTRILVCNGADDPFVPAEQIEAFQAEMQAVEASYELVNYEGAVHGFTNPAATAAGESFDLPLKYDSKADADSWARLTKLFDETLR